MEDIKSLTESDFREIQRVIDLQLEVGLTDLAKDNQESLDKLKDFKLFLAN